jgi:hypothetical protein
LETKSIHRLLGLLALGRMSGWVRVYPPPPWEKDIANAALPPQANLSTLPWYVGLLLHEGEVQQCSLYWANTQIDWPPQRVLSFLEQQGRLWYDEPELPAPQENLARTLSQETNTVLTRVHCRLVSDTDMMRSRTTFSREAWRILSLIDGRHSDGEIILLTGLSADVVMEILVWFEQQGWIQ